MKTKLIMLLILTVALMANAVSAKEVATATLVDPADLPLNYAVPTPETVGNLNPAQWLLGGWFVGQESYAFIFNPSEQLTCQMGFQLTQVHMLLDFAGPVTFDVYADLGSAVIDPATGCTYPGEENCTGATYTVTIAAAGTYDIAIPIECECAYIYDVTGAPYIYYLSMHFPTAFDAQVVTDGIQAACTSYNDWGQGWQDLTDYFGSYGNVNMWGDVICCTDPVGVEETSWGDVKSLFR